MSQAQTRTSSRDLKYRTFRSRSTSPWPGDKAKCSIRARAYKTWEDISMTKAIEAVEDGVSIRRAGRAAEMYNVPRSTLNDRTRGKIVHGAHSGPPYLTPSEDDELARFLIRCARIGYPRSRQQVLALVQQVMKSKGIQGTSWWSRYKVKHKELALRTLAPLSHV